MSDRARDLLTHGIAAAKANDKAEAEFYLEWVLRSESTHNQKIRAWEWLAQMADNPKKKRDYLEEIIMREPGNVTARRGLAMLNSDLQAEDIIDPTHQGPAAASTRPEGLDGGVDIQGRRHGPGQLETESTTAKRFVCQQCGGLMCFTPDGQLLVCHYCGQEMNLYQAIQAGAVIEEQDFAVALATAKGHTHPVTMQAFSCQGCGAPFVLGPAILSLTCPYCDSAHVIEARETRQLIPPEGLIPFDLTEEQIRKPFIQWLKKRNLLKKCQVRRPVGLYLPVWAFDIAGSVTASVRGYRQGGTNGIKMPSQSLEQPVLYQNIPVLASHRLPKRLGKAIFDFDLSHIVPYNLGYLADWPADTYQISAAEASLMARKWVWQESREMVAAQMRHQVASPLGSSNLEMSFSSANIYIEAFKLILVPVWVVRYRHQARMYEAVINGQNGRVRGQAPRGRFKRWLDKLLKSR